jgi:hypothetical protein
VVSGRIAGVADNHDQHPPEAEENAADGEQRGPRAVNSHGKKKSPDRGSGIDHGGDVAGHSALAPGEEGKRESVVEQGNSDEPGQQAPRRQLVATETEHSPEQSRSQRAA